MSDRPIQIDPPSFKVPANVLRRIEVPPWVWLFAFLGLVSFTIINYEPYGLSWDPAYYLHNAVCMNRAVYDFSLSRIETCLNNTAKGPIMEVLALPWGRAGSSYSGIGLAFVGLAFFIWTLALLTFLTSMRAAVPMSSLFLAAASICFVPFLRTTAGDMMTDTLLGWSVALALMLIPLEYNSPQAAFWPSVLRGLLWGFVIDVGMLSKVTFAFFLGAVGLALFGIRWWRSGIRPLGLTVGACLVGATPAILIWATQGGTFLSFARRVAWGDLAHLWDVPGTTVGSYLKDFSSSLSLALIPLFFLLILYVRGLLIEQAGRVVRLIPIGIIVVYLLTAAVSQNRDPRFTIPVLIAMPLCLSWTSTRIKDEKRIPSMLIVIALVLGALSAIPAMRRPEIAPIQRTGELLKRLSQGRSTAIIVATEGSLFNIETVELARQIGGEYLRPIQIDTLAYDEVNKRTLEDGLRRIDKANFVLFLKPGNAPSPDWTMTHAADYRAYCEKVGLLMDAQTSPDFSVFKIN